MSDLSYMPDIHKPERDPEAESWRKELATRDCIAYRQWGGNPAMAIFLPTLPGEAGPRIAVVNYADHPDRATARKQAYRLAIETLRHRDAP